MSNFNIWITLLTIVVVMGSFQGGCLYLVLLERRLCAWMQDRVGPNRVGPMGLLQPLADGLQFLFKDDILGDWSSNNKYSFIGALGSSAQLVSYEIPMGMSILGIVVLTGSLNLERMIQHQVYGGWNIWYQPLAFLLFLTSAFAECNRL